MNARGVIFLLSYYTTLQAVCKGVSLILYVYDVQMYRVRGQF